MKNSVFILAFLLSFQSGFSTDNFSVSSPDGHIKVNAKINDKGQPFYSVTFNDSMVLINSKLGILMADNDFSQNLKIQKTTNITDVSDSYVLFSEKKLNCTY